MTALDFGFFAIAKSIWFLFSMGGWFGVLWYCLMVSRDYRTRRMLSDATAHLTLNELEAGLRANLLIVTAYQQMPRKTNPATRKAERALVMSTVLWEHIARTTGQHPMPTYLRSRRAVLRAAKRMARKSD